MPDTNTTRLGLLQMLEGSHTNEWGDILNLNIGRLDSAVRGKTTIALSGAKTLVSNDITGVSSTPEEEAFFMFYEFTGTAGTVTVPAIPSVWIVYNNADADFTFQPDGGTGVVVAQGRVSTIVADGAGTTFTDVTNLMGAGQLSDLTDVGLTTPTDQNALMADGDSWESRPLVEADISDLGTVVITTTGGQTIGGDLTATTFLGAVTGDVAGDLTGTVITAAQPNITSLGKITTFESTGIDDNADQTVLTIGADESSTFVGVINVGANGSIGSVGADLDLDSDAQLILRTNGTTPALTLDASQDATFVGTVNIPAATTVLPSANIPHGVAPTSPVDGDVWTQNDGVFVRVAGVSENLLTSGGGEAAASITTYTGTGDGVQTLWVAADLTPSVGFRYVAGGLGRLMLFIDGVFQNANQYVETSNTSFTTTEAIPDGSGFTVLTIGVTDIANLVTGIDEYSWIGDGADLVVNAGDMTPATGFSTVAELLQVYYDGVLRPNSEWTLTTGTQVTFVTAPPNGAEVLFKTTTALSLPSVTEKVNGLNAPARNSILNQVAVNQDDLTQSGFSAAIYTGNGTGIAVNTGVDMATDDFGGLVWIKDRDTIASHVLFDTVRGVNQAIVSDTTAAEITAADSLSSFTSTGFTAGTYANSNNVGLMAAWAWQTTKKAEQGVNVCTDTPMDVTADWAKGTNWTVAGTAVHTSGFAGILRNNDSTEIGKTYVITFDILATNNTGWYSNDGVSDIDDISALGVGTHKVVVTAAATQIGFRAGSTNTITIDNVYIQEALYLTNRNKPYTSHYNPDLGFSIVGYQGDGLEGHEIPHHLGVEPELSIFKNRSAIDAWIVQSPLFGYTEYLVLDTTAALASLSDLSTLFSDTTLSVGGRSNYNGSGDNYISYHFASVAGTSKIGKYIGTGAVGNYVDCGFKPAFVILKNLNSASGEWIIVDSQRGAAYLVPNTSAAETVSATIMDFVDDGFSFSNTFIATNQLNSEYLFMAYAESATGGSGLNLYTNTDYTYPTAADTLSIAQNTLIGFAQGFDATGQADSQETVGASVTHVLGAGHENKHYYIYKDLAGSYGTTENRPLTGITRNDADKWGEVAPLDVTLRTTAKHFDYESSTGVASASEAEIAGVESYLAFNKTTNDIVVDQQWSIAAATGWLQYKQTEKRILKSWRYRHGSSTAKNPTSFTIEGSNDGLDWTVIDNTYGAGGYTDNGSSRWGDLQSTSGNTTAYLYHRINVTVTSGGVEIQIAELEFNTILPSDYYLIGDGVMHEYLGTELVTEPTIIGAEWTVTGSTTIVSQEAVYSGGVGALTNLGVPVVAGEKYRITLDVTVATSGSLVAHAGGSAFEVIPSPTVGIYTVELVAIDGALMYVYADTGDFIGTISSLSVQKINNNPIERTYLAEFKTDSDGDVINNTLVNLPVAKQQFSEVEVHQDLTVHGEIKNTGVCTAWVNFDAAQNPPLVLDSYNVADVVDTGVGVYDIVFESPMDNKGYTLSANAVSARFVGANTYAVNKVTLTSYNSAGAATEGTFVSVAIHGGKTNV